MKNRRISLLAGICCSALLLAPQQIGNLRAEPLPVPADAPPSVRPAAIAATGLVINELMSSNSAVAPDEDATFQDWIEVYNGGASIVNLDQYGLSDDPALPFKWRFPSVSIAPGGFLLIFASDKNRTAPNLHTNFKISADGETITLTDPLSNTVDQLPPVGLPTNVSYGRSADGGASFLYFSTSTPAQSNALGASASVSAPQFLTSGGFYPVTQSLTLSSTAAGAVIRYTLDGSEPGPASAVYTGPLEIGDVSPNPYRYAGLRTTGTDSQAGIGPWIPPVGNVTKGAVVRARAFTGSLSSTVATQTYFVGADLASRYNGLPVISVVLDPRDLFSDTTGMYVLGADPGTLIPYQNANFFLALEKTGHLEFYEEDRQQVLSQGVDVRMHGNWSRAQPMKTLRLYARSKYGAPNFEHPIFDTKPITRYQRLLLRNGGNDFTLTMLRDPLIQTVAPPSQLNQAYEPAAVLVNGEFWGLHNIRERIDEYFIEGNTGIARNQIDLLEREFTGIEVTIGSTVTWEALVGYLQANSLAVPANYDYIQTQIDIENFTDYVLLNVWADNRDWPNNNVRMWRAKASSGRWRWIPFGSEASLGFPGWSNVNNDTIEFINNDEDSQVPLILRRLMENDRYKTYFAQRASDVFNIWLRPETVNARLNAMQQRIAGIMPEHINRWGYPGSVASWEGNTDDIRDFVALRPGVLRPLFASRFGYAGAYTATFSVSPPNAGAIAINTWSGPVVTATAWSGIYYESIPLSATVSAASGYQFVAWSGDTAGAQISGGAIVLTPTTNINLIAQFALAPTPTPAPTITPMPSVTPAMRIRAYLPVTLR
jgi:CotH kinase protein/Lamin Tail Domain/Chitobiase/beta-hexosaminidase C-terminal domain